MSERPSILLITFDSLRPDHLGCYGYRGTETPNFDRLAAEGVRFTAAYCQAPNTWMSHACLFTGCNPPRNGVRSPLGRLNPQLPTLAELFQSAGYRTFGLPSVSLLSREAGFHRGFDVYPLEGLLSEFHGAAHFRDLGESLRLLDEWLAAAPPPWFIWLHYFGTHVVQGKGPDGRPAELSLPAVYRRRFSPFAQHYDGKIAYADREFLGPVLDMVEGRLSALGSPASALQGGQQADAALTHRLIVALLSDHGEDLHAVETGLPGHDTGLAEEVVRVPLVLWAPDLIPAGHVIETPVRLIDVYPTLAELTGLPLGPPPSGLRPQDSGLSTQAVDGISLCEYWPATPSPLSPQSATLRRPPSAVCLADRDVYLENLYQGCLGVRHGRQKLILSRARREGFYRRHVAWRLDRLGTALLPDRLLRPLRQRGRRRRQRDHFRTPPDVLWASLLAEGAHAVLYDVERDPQEQTNVADEDPDLVAALRSRLGQIGSGRAVSDSGYTPEQEAAIQERLSDLGYL